MARIRYIATQNPQLFCPTCNTHLRISCLEKKLWCEKCFEYINEDIIVSKFTKGIL